MSDDFEGLFGGPTPSGLELPDPVSAITAALGRLDLASISGSSLSTRGELVAMRNLLMRLERFAHDRRAAIERAFVIAAAEDGSDQIRTSAGLVRLKAPQGTYETRAQALREELARLIPASISQEELDKACPVVISYTVNHTHLNTLHSHRGDAVREVIDRHRTKVPPDPYRANATFPKEEKP